MTAKLAADAGFARDVQCRVVASQDVLDDRETEAHAAVRSCPTAIHAEEAFGQARQVDLGDAFAGIAHGEVAAPGSRG